MTELMVFHSGEEMRKALSAMIRKLPQAPLGINGEPNYMAYPEMIVCPEVCPTGRVLNVADSSMADAIRRIARTHSSPPLQINKESPHP